MSVLDIILAVGCLAVAAMSGLSVHYSRRALKSHAEAVKAYADAARSYEEVAMLREEGRRAEERAFWSRRLRDEAR